MELKIGSCSEQGPSWEENLDAVHVQQAANLTVCLVADGCGNWRRAGHGNSIAHWLVHDLVHRIREQLSDSTGDQATSDAIRMAVSSVNSRICEFSIQGNIDNAGAAVVLAIRRDDEVMWVSGIGDSRAYLIRNAGLEQLTVDDSIANALVKHGKMTVEESLQSPWRYVLWKYLPSKEVGDGLEVKCVMIQPGDRFLLCTNGLTYAVPDEALLNCIQEHSDPQRCAEALCQLALERGSRDNVSCIVIEVV